MLYKTADPKTSQDVQERILGGRQNLKSASFWPKDLQH